MVIRYKIFPESLRTKDLFILWVMLTYGWKQMHRQMHTYHHRKKGWLPHLIRQARIRKPPPACKTCLWYTCSNWIPNFKSISQLVVEIKTFCVFGSQRHFTTVSQKCNKISLSACKMFWGYTYSSSRSIFQVNIAIGCGYIINFVI